MHGIDNKAGVVALIELVRRVRRPPRSIDIVFTVREEIGGRGASYYASTNRPAIMLAMDVMPVAEQHNVGLGHEPVVATADPLGPLDAELVSELSRAADSCGATLRKMVWSAGASDASMATLNGHVARAGCLGWATENTHGYEITSLAAIRSCIELLVEWLGQEDEPTAHKLGPVGRGTQTRRCGPRHSWATRVPTLSAACWPEGGEESSSLTHLSAHADQRRKPNLAEPARRANRPTWQQLHEDALE